MNRYTTTFGALAAAASIGPACATGAIAIRECREIELLRCEAEAECGVIDDVPACKRYVRDHCLHGIEGPRVPTRPEQDACVGLVEDAKACAAEDPKMRARDCDEFEAGDLALSEGVTTAARSVCDVISRPWDFRPCDFLNASAGGAGGDDSK
jgi:hypothetical protein